VQNNPFIQSLNLFIFILFFVSGVSYAEGLPPLTHKLTALTKPVMAPTLQLQNMDEEMVDIKDLKGKIIVVNFWATWCPPCRREMGSLERFYQATKVKNVELLAVNIGEDIDTVFSFLGTVDPSPTFTMLFDPDGLSMKSWNVLGLPTTFIVNPEGEIVYRAVGGREFDHPDIQKAVLDLNK